MPLKSKKKKASVKVKNSTKTKAKATTKAKGTRKREPKPAVGNPCRPNGNAHYAFGAMHGKYATTAAIRKAIEKGLGAEKKAKRDIGTRLDNLDTSASPGQLVKFAQTFAEKGYNVDVKGLDENEKATDSTKIRIQDAK